MKKLLIVESPAKIKTIAKFLDKSFKIMSTMGHIKDLPQKKIGVTAKGNTYVIEYVPIKDKEKIIADIAKEAQTAQEIFLAPDPDREGEIIAWHIAKEIEKVAKKNAAIYRIAFNEITKSAIQEAIAHPSTINEQRVAAQQARRVLDRWVGYEVSPILWKKLAPGLSAGRVQSVALRLICDREEAIRIFKTEEYWTIEGIFKEGKAELITQLTHINKKKPEISTEAAAKKLVVDIKKESYVISEITDKKRVKQPYAPFMTSTLQQAAYNVLGFSVKKTMQVAQQLYEGLPLDDSSNPVALITYMRTDSLRIADSAIDQVRAFIKEQFSKEYLPTRAQEYIKKTKTAAQDAHEAIRPIDVSLTPAQVKKYLPTDAAKLYELIWKRFVACQMSPAEYAQRQVVIIGGKYTFKATGSTLLFDGFLKVYAADEEEKEDKVIIPQGIKQDQAIDLNNTVPKQHFTQPPPRYTEASLVKELEKEGIGRPSTYATILTTIRSRSYTSLDQKKRFVPTELGMTVSKMLVEHLPNIMDISFTANLEHELDKIALGELERDKMLHEFRNMFTKELTTFQGKDHKIKKESIPTEIECPECGKATLVIRFGKSGEFLGCPRYPECNFTSNFKRNEQGEIEIIHHEKPQLLDEKCPDCGKQLRQMQGRYGSFIACSGYPACKYIKKVKAPFACPLDKHDVVQKFWRGGAFFGCDNYPQCKFAVFDPVEMKPCPDCKWPFLTKKTDKKGDVTWICANKECGYKHKA
jgi:DNA topoisomerase I